MEHIQFTKRQHEIIEGLMLGDGGLWRRKTTHNPVLRVNRSLIDLEYNNWLKEEFCDILPCSLNEMHTLDKRTNKVYSSSVLRTVSSKLLLPYYERWYPNNKKAIPDDLVLSPLTLAVWFADDGCVQNIDKWSLDMKISTNGFSNSDVAKLVQKITQLLSVKFHVYQNNGQPTIRGFTSASLAFLRIIDPVFPPLFRKSDLWRFNDGQLLKGKALKPKCPKCVFGKVYSYGKYQNGKLKFKCIDCVSCFAL